MVSRIKQRFDELAKSQKKALISFTMACDPDFKTSLAILKKLPESGADLIELGMPFSDPMADGPAIQDADIRALKSGAKLTMVFEMVREFRKEDEKTPIILMGYYNPVHHYGLKKFVTDAKSYGVDGFIIVDLPPEEDDELFDLCMHNSIDNIKLLTPTTDEARLKVILQKASGFLYYVSIAGITGTKIPDYTKVELAVKQVKQHTSLPIAVGFGINNSIAVTQVHKFADAVVVGSAIVKQIAASSKDEVVANVTSFVRSLKE